MSFNTVRALFVASLLALLAADASAQAGRHVALLSQAIDPAPRSRALGEAGVLLRGEPGIAALNPAALSSRHHVQARGGSDPWLQATGAGTELTSLSLAYGRDRWTLAYDFRELDFGLHESRDADNTILGYRRAYDVAHALTGAYALTPGLHVGAGLNYLLSAPGVDSIDGRPARTVRTVTLDLGLHYARTWGGEVVAVRPLAAWSLTDVGRTMAYVEGDREGPPTMMRAGLGLETGFLRRWLDRPLLRIGLYGAAAKMISAVDDEGEPYGSLGALVRTWRPVEVEWAGEELSVADQLMWSRGAELSLLGIFSLRRGHFEEHALNGARDFDTRGWGVDLYFVAFDVATIEGVKPTHPLADTRIATATVRVPLGDRAEGNFWPELLDRLVR